MLEFVGAIDVNSTEQRVLDKLKVEKDRGITVKAQTCSLIYRCAKGQLISKCLFVVFKSTKKRTKEVKSKNKGTLFH
jgi:translation elongation factor EF-4